MFYSAIQPGLLSSNTSLPLSGLEVGQIYEAQHPAGMPNPILVMYIQAAAKITYPGMILRQEASILTGETHLALAEANTTHTVTRIEDADCGISDAFIPGTEDQMNGSFTNPGYFAWKNDATATVPEIAEVASYAGDGSATGVFYLSPQHPFDTLPADADEYIVFRPGRMKLVAANEAKPAWGVSAAPLTDEYYGFMVIRGFYYVLANTDQDAAADMTAGEGIIVSDAAGYAQSGTNGTDDVGNVGMTMYASNSIAATTLQLVPAYIRGFPA